MKKSTLLALVLGITMTSFAQINRGQFLIGGLINFQSTKNEYSNDPNYKLNTISISPNIGYFIIDKIAAGVRIDIRSYKSNSGVLEARETTTGIEPFLRYYFLPGSKKVNAFIDGSYVHDKTKTRYYSSSDYFFEMSRGYHFSAGPSIFLTNQIALEFTVGYEHIKSNDSGNAKVSTFSSGFGLQVHLGKIKNKAKLHNEPATKAG